MALSFLVMLIAALPLAATAEDMAFYEGKVSSSQPMAEEDAAKVEPAAGPVCRDVPKSPCASGHGAVYSTDENGCRVFVRCQGLMLRPTLGTSR